MGRRNAMFFTREEGDKHKVQGFLRRVCDLTSPNLPRQEEFRGHNRHNRTIPVLLTPWENDMPVVSETTTALTKDISDRGLCVTTPQPFRCEQAVVGIWLPHRQNHTPWFFRGCVRPNVQIGGGFWALGLEVAELLTVSPGSEIARLVTLTQRLLPSTVLDSDVATPMLAK